VALSDKRMTKRGLLVVGLPLFAVVILFWYQERRSAQLQQQVAALQSQIAAAEKPPQDNSRLQEQLKSATDEADDLQHELMRLRSDQTTLLKENAALKATVSTPSVAPARPRDPTSVPEVQPYHYTQDQTDYFVERLDFGKKVGFALQKLAQANDGQLPDDLKPVAKWLATNTVPIAGDTGPLFAIGTSSFELVYKGNMNNLAHPDQVILARETNPVEVHEERWTRMYVFADGSVQRLEATTADGFASREQEVWSQP
jgi:hypothetical protein